MKIVPTRQICVELPHKSKESYCKIWKTAFNLFTMKHIIFLVFFVLLSNAAHADAGFYRSDQYKCSNRSFLSEWRIERSGDRVSVIAVETEASNGRRTRSEWNKDFSDSIQLEDKRDQPRFKILNLSTPDGPEIEVSDRRGDKDKRCSDMNVASVASFADRMSEYSSLLSMQQIDRDTVDQVLALKPNLPPFELLPSAQIPAQKGKITYSEKLFWENYGEQQTKIASDPETADFDVTSAIAEIFRIIGNVEDKDLMQKQRDVVAKIQVQRSDRAFLAGKDPIQFANQDPTEICSRLPLLGRRTSSDDFMINLSGLALEYWTKDFSSQMVAYTSACPKGDRVSKSVEKYWSTIEKKKETMDLIITERDRLISQRRTIESMRDAHWLTIKLDKKGTARIKGDEIERFTGPVLRKARKEAVAPLRVEMVGRLNDRSLSYDELEKICFSLHGGYKSENTLALDVFIDCDDLARKALDEKLAEAVEVEEKIVTDGLSASPVPLFDLGGYCRRRAKKRDETKIFVTQALHSACERASAAHFQDDFMEKFNRRIKRIKNSAPNIDSLRRNNWFNFDEDFSAAPSEQTYLAKAILELENTITNLPENIVSHRELAVKNGVREIKNAYAAADPLEKSDDQARELCADVPKNMGEYLRPLITACALAESEMSGKRERKQCARVWDSVPNSTELQQGALITPNGFNEERNPIRVLFCQVGQQNTKFSITHKKRLFSSTYQVSRKVSDFQGSGRTVTLTANFKEADDGFNAWELTDGQVTYPNGSTSNLANEGANLALCMFTSRVCARR